MATQTRVLGSVGDAQDPPHQAQLEIDFDDVTLLLTAVRVINDTNQVARVTVSKTDGTRSVTKDTPAGTIGIQAIPTGQAARLQLTVTPSGKLDGVDYHFLLI